MQSYTSKQKYSIAIIVAILIVAIFAMFWWRHEHRSSKPAKVVPHAIIDVTPSGFVPATLNVKAGTTIIWQNQDSATHKVASNPYPLDNSVPSLNSGTILPNGSYRYLPKSAGTIYYHDDTKPTLNGTIVVSK